VRNTDDGRKKLRRWERERDVRFLTFSTFRRRPVMLDSIKDFFASELARARRDFGMELFAWVIMPEHVHLLMRASGAPWATIAKSIKTETSKCGLGTLRRVGSEWLEELERGDDNRPRFWQHGGGFDRNCRNNAEVTKAIRYIHLNPVERGLVEKPEDWKWSSVRWWMGMREGEIECDPLPGDPRAWAEWKGFV
jgi:putative transposase